MAKKTIKDRNNKAIAPATRSDMVFRRDHKNIDEVMLVTEPQELTPEQRTQVQTNIGVKSTVDVVGAGEVKEILLVIAKDNTKRDSSGTEVSQSGAFISKPIRVNRGDKLTFTCLATIYYGLISAVDAENNLISVLRIADEGTKEYTFLCLSDMYISFSAVKPVFNIKISPCKLAGLLAEPAGGYPADLYKAVGAIRDEAKGVWLLNELELTNEEMAEVVTNTDSLVNLDMSLRFYLKKFRTNIPFNNIGGPSSRVKLNNCFNGCSKAEIINVGECYVAEMAAMFINCINLRKILGHLYVVGVQDFNVTFNRCEKLETAYMKSLSKSISFKDSPLLSVEDTADSTLGYMIENAANTDPITITLHPDAYAKIPESLKTKAQEKQISIVSV